MAIQTPGAVDYALTNTVVTLEIDALSPISLSCWINATWNGGSRLSMVGTYHSVDPSTAVQVGTSTGSGECSIWTWGGNVMVESPAGIMVNGVWTHIVYTHNSGTHRLYVNGVLSSSTTNAVQQAGILSKMFINGFPTGGSSETGDYQCSNIQWYTHELTQNEITTLYYCRGLRAGMLYKNAALYSCDGGSVGTTVSILKDEGAYAVNMIPVGTAIGVNFTYTTDPLPDTRPPL